MLRSRLFILALVTSLLACGPDEKSETPVAASTLEPARYPKVMPASELDDSRLIGYWKTPCEVSGSESTFFTLLLDQTKAVLEKQVYRDTQCQEAAYTTRFYMTYRVKAEIFEGRIWEVHANIQAQDRLNTILDSQTCSLATVRDDVWYDLTGTGCQLKEKPASMDRGSALISSSYAMGLNHRQISVSILGKTGLKFTRID